MSQTTLSSDPSVRRRVWRSAGTAALWVALLGPIALGWPRCPIASLLHTPCPGCGMSRAVELLLRGHVRASLQMHPVVVPALAVLVLLAASTVGAALSGGSPAEIHRRPLGRVAIALACAVYALALGVWVARALGALGGPVPLS